MTSSAEFDKYADSYDSALVEALSASGERMGPILHKVESPGWQIAYAS